MQYQGFTYELDPRSGGWKLTFPHGQKLIAPPQTEDDLKKAIDALHAGLGV
jgi:hypothetical protein